MFFLRILGREYYVLISKAKTKTKKVLKNNNKIFFSSDNYTYMGKVLSSSLESYGISPSKIKYVTVTQTALSVYITV